MKSILSLLLLNLVCSQAPPIKLPDGRIVGGYEVTPKFKYPWVVSLQYGNIHACGGTLYNQNTVISAAHCVVGEDQYWHAALHRHNVLNPTEPNGGKTYDVTSRIIHPNYISDTQSGYDIAVWKINAPTNTPPTPTGVQLDSGTFANAENTLLKIIGWGRTSYGGKRSWNLLEVKVPVFNLNACKQAYSDALVTGVQFCAGYPEGGKDSCQGDSGGPLFNDSNGTPTLVGIVSWGKECALKGYPGVYTRVSNFTRWIQQNAQ